MGKERVFSHLTCLSVFVCCLFLLSIPARAANFTVNSSSDASDTNPGDGVCITPGALCTLRAAIEEANALAGADQIILPPNAYVLTILTTTAELAIAGDLTITGSGASTTIIDGNRAVRPDSGVLRVNSGVTVRISGVTIQNGGRTTNHGGGGILNFGAVTLIDSVVSGNSVATWMLGQFIVGGLGGGIHNLGGRLTLINSTVSGNSAGGGGGGIYGSGIMMLTNSTVSDNSANSNDGRGGGGIFNAGAMTLISSTVSGNSVASNGGGIYNEGTVMLTNSTVSGNSANSNGGGIFVINGNAVNSFASTITENTALFGSGGGVHTASGGVFNFQNTILAINSEVFPLPSTPSDCAGTINSNGNNLMFSISGCTVIGGGVTVDDPLLGPLQDNGGPTLTHALLAGSPAIDASNIILGCRDHFGALLLADQRGFFRTADGNQDGNARCDIGAYEANAVIGNEAFVFKQYVDFLDREPDPGGLAAWVNALNGGYPRASLIEAFMDSGEFRFKGKFIAQTYLGILTRDADVGGFEAWLGALLAGVSREQIVQGFLGSGEFQSSFGSNLTNAQFVERMYNNILLRSSDPGGFNFWVGILDSGQLTRAQLALIFLDSGEFQSLSVSQNRVDISLLYFDMLQRGPDAGGFSWWVGVLNAGIPLTSVIDAFLNSAEYKARF